jgi:hypothetical protein
MTAKFQVVQLGIRDGEQVEITSGVTEGARVITTGATALKDGDRIVPANSGGGRRGAGGTPPPDGQTDQAPRSEGPRQGGTR